MAKPSPRSARGQPARAAAKSKKAVSSEVEGGTEEAPGIGIDAGLAILTSVALVGALVLIDMIQGKNGDAIFFN